MRKFLGLDSPFVQFMERFADFFLLNLLTILCSIPLITAGAALTAHSRVMQNLVMDEEEPVYKAYFRSFRENFRQATVFWLVALVLIVLYVMDGILIYLYFDEALAELTKWILGILGVVATGILCYAFPLIGRYENSLKEHLRNSFILAIGGLPRTLLLVLLTALPILPAFVSLELFINLVIVWFTFGISIIIFFQALLLKPVFLRLEDMAVEDDSAS